MTKEEARDFWHHSAAMVHPDFRNQRNPESPPILSYRGNGYGGNIPITFKPNSFFVPMQISEGVDTPFGLVLCDSHQLWFASAEELKQAFGSRTSGSRPSVLISR